jgi:hypothetical protein
MTDQRNSWVWLVSVQSWHLCKPLIIIFVIQASTYSAAGETNHSGFQFVDACIEGGSALNFRVLVRCL